MYVRLKSCAFGHGLQKLTRASPTVLQARFHPDPVALYTRLYSKGVGHRSAALHLAWAQQLELRGMLEQAEAVYQRAVTNHAQPADAILNQYR